MAAAPHYPDELIQKVETILKQDPKTVGPITQWGQALAALKEANVAYEVEDVHPRLIMTHPDNRGKLGVNAFNAHRVGAYIKRVGADLAELKKATAFELSAVGDRKLMQLSFNQNMVDRSKGMLAPLSGSERYLSVSCGHTAQFAKAAAASCTTPQPALADTNGCLNIQHLAKDDPTLHAMLTKGWSWTVLPWQVEETWPTLPDLAQRALNASNSVASQASELETASTIAEFAQLQHGDAVNWEACVEAAAASMPPCASYIKTIGTYVRLYGGGDGAPIVKYLDEFGKSFGENRRLGEEFLKAVTDAVFSSVSTRYPHIRTGLIATNLVAPKVIDGVARLLVKSDVERLRAKDRIQTIDEAERMMAEGWKLVQDLVSAKSCSTTDTVSVLGRLHCRTTLHITGKAKLGFEKRQFNGMQDIKNAFMTDLKAILPPGCPIPCDWDTASQPEGATVKATSATQATSAGSAAQPMVDMSKLSNPKWLAEEAGFVVGKAYYEKAMGSEKLFFILTEVGTDVAKLAKHQPCADDKPEYVQVDLDSLVKKWVLYKGELPAQINDDKVVERAIAASEHFTTERKKGIAFQTLLSVEQMHASNLKMLRFMVNPLEVRAAMNIAKGKLELAPATDLKGISSKATPGAPCVGVEAQKFGLSEPTRARSSNPTHWKSETVFVPYWWVATTSNIDEANMTFKQHTLKGTGVVFHMLTNSKPLVPNDKLLVYKEKKAAATTAKVVQQKPPPEDQKPGDIEPAAQAKRRRSS